MKIYNVKHIVSRIEELKGFLSDGKYTHCLQYARVYDEIASLYCDLQYALEQEGRDSVNIGIKMEDGFIRKITKKILGV